MPQNYTSANSLPQMKKKQTNSLYLSGFLTEKELEKNNWGLLFIIILFQSEFMEKAMFWWNNIFENVI